MERLGAVMVVLRCFLVGYCNVWVVFDEQNRNMHKNLKMDLFPKEVVFASSSCRMSQKEFESISWLMKFIKSFKIGLVSE